MATPGFRDEAKLREQAAAIVTHSENDPRGQVSVKTLRSNMEFAFSESLINHFTEVLQLKNLSLLMMVQIARKMAEKFPDFKTIGKPPKKWCFVTNPLLVTCTKPKTPKVHTTTPIFYQYCHLPRAIAAPEITNKSLEKSLFGEFSELKVRNFFYVKNFWRFRSRRFWPRCKNFWRLSKTFDVFEIDCVNSFWTSLYL